LLDVLDTGRVAHVGVVDGDQPFVVPLAYARLDDSVVVHGSTGSRAFRLLAQGVPACLTVTLLDGYVLARAAFETSMRYRAAMVLGSFTVVGDRAEKTAALAAISEAAVPGRWADMRPPSAKELAATSVLAIGLAEWSVKANDGWPTDEEEDLDLPVWAGVVPLAAVARAPLPAPDLDPALPVPDYLSDVPLPGLHA